MDKKGIIFLILTIVGGIALVAAGVLVYAFVIQGALGGGLAGGLIGGGVCLIIWGIKKYREGGF